MSPDAVVEFLGRGVEHSDMWHDLWTFSSNSSSVWHVLWRAGGNATIEGTSAP